MEMSVYQLHLTEGNSIQVACEDNLAALFLHHEKQESLVLRDGNPKTGRVWAVIPWSIVVWVLDVGRNTANIEDVKRRMELEQARTNIEIVK